MFRATAGLAVNLCIRLHVHPDTISCLSIAPAALAGICFWQAGRHPWLLVVGPLPCYVRLWLNMLDGMVAVAAGRASWRGEIFNDLPDRVSDVLIFVGVAHSGLCAIPSGYWAAIFALLTAYVGVFAQALGLPRQFGGITSKPWRMVTLHFGAWTAYALWRWAPALSTGPLTVLDWTCILVIAGCAQTIGARLARILALLDARQHDAGGKS